MTVRCPVAPLRPGWLIVDGRPVYHRFASPASGSSTTIVHVHGFGISGTYLEPTAALLAASHRTFVPDLPGMGRSHRPAEPLDLPGLARAVMSYCDVVGVDRATFVGNSLGCPIIIELATRFPERVERVVLVSPAGGPNNQPIARAIAQMIADAPREPLALLPIAVGDYLRFGFRQGWSLFRSMTRYPSLERVGHLVQPTLVVAGDRDPLVRVDRAWVFAGLPHVEAVEVSGAHALNFSRPELIAHLVESYITGRALTAPPGSHDSVAPITIDRRDSGR